MATYAQIELTFNEDLIAEDNLTFYYGFAQSIYETWKTLRTSPYQVTVGTPTGNVGERTAINYIQSIEADFSFLEMVVTRNVNVVTIKATNPLYQFAFAPGLPTVNVSYVIDNTTEDLLYISSVEFATATTAIKKCENVSVIVNTNILADKLTSPITIDPVETNPIIFDYVRGVTIPITVETPTGRPFTLITELPSALNSALLNINVDSTPQGSNVTIDVSQNGLLTLEFSLDDVTYQSSNIFTGLLPNDYTVYVKDQFGCKTAKNFVTDEFQTVNSPIFTLPEENSIRFANRVVFGDCGNYKNDFNTLSCEADVPLPKQEILQFQACDVITTQFKSNYEANSVEINNAEFSVTQKTQNMKRKDSRDAILCNLGDGSNRTGIYFLSGDVYDFDSGDVIGNYALNGALPEWGKAGNYVKHPNGIWYVIEDIVYLESKSADVLIISTGTEQVGDEVVKVSCFYNFLDYEVFEFTIDFFNYLDEQLQVKILAVDSRFDEVEFLSEVIDVKVRHLNTIEIKYSSDENTDVYYQTGITHTIRVPLEYKEASHQSGYDSYDTDNDTILISSDIRKLKTFVFAPMTEQMMDKVLIAVSHKFVTMDRVPYKIESSESELLGQTNTYDVKVTMKLKNSLYNSNGLQFDESGLEIPALIPTGTGYVKYQ